MWYYMIVTQYFIFALSLVLEYTSLVLTLGFENLDLRLNIMLLTKHCIVSKNIVCFRKPHLNKIHENDNRVSLLSYAEYPSEVK